MMKRLLVLIAFCGMTLNLTGCTSTDTKQDSEAVSEYDSSELERLDGQASTDAISTGDAAADSSLSSDKLPEDALGETAAAPPNESTAPDFSTTTSSLSSGDVNNESSTSPLVESPAAVDSSTASNDIMPPAAESTPLLESAPSTNDVTNAEPPAPKPAPVALQKMASSPWTVGKTIANTVYFARPGDSLSSVSQMIYGADKTKELKKINPSLRARSVKPGDKIYYNSPHRPDDASRLITYYEDSGVPPEVYTAKAGDNIRKVSKELLGYDGAWKEIWASNSVDSKGAINEGTQLNYWKMGSVAAAPAAPTESMAQAPAQETAMNENAAGLPTEQQVPAQATAQDSAQMELPPPPPMPTEQLPPPPDMAQNAAPPPPPPAAMENHNNNKIAAEPAAGMDSDTTLALAVVGLAAAGLAVLIVMRKKRKQRDLDHGISSDTQVGT